MPEQVSSAALADTSLITFERLEWGKLCQAHDGPIVRSAEHRTLGRSQGFPADVAGLCNPDQIGPVSGEEDYEPAGYPHGTVLRPVVRQGRITPVMARVRRRPEDGEGGTARLYYLARYLAAGTAGHDPLVLFAAMESLPLAGLTEGEAQSIGALAATAEPPEVDGALPFLEKAVVYALSGVPMTITEPLPERTFFTWVTALWWLLPAPLRPLLSCGWGVAWQLSGALLVAHSSEAAANSAVFSPSERSWRDPARTVLGRGEEEQQSEFSLQRLIPGRLYAHLAFGSAGERPRIESLSGANGASAFAPSVDTAELPPLPDLRDPATVRALRCPGLEAVDAHRLSEAGHWLESGEAAAGDPLAAFTTGLIYSWSRIRMAALALPALAGLDEQRKRAEMLLWRLLLESKTAEIRELVARSSGPGAARGQLLASLARADEEPGDEALFEILERLREAAEREEGATLPDEVRPRLVAALGRSLERLDPRLANGHAQLVRSPRLPADYEPWLRERSHDFLFALGRWQPPELAATLLRLGALLGSRGIDALGHWFMGHLPGEGDAEALDTLPASIRQRFSRFLTEAWERPGGQPAALRERVLAWFAIQPPSASQDALLHFALGRDPAPEEVVDIAREVERGAVPSSLVERLALLVLTRWALLGDRLRRQTTAWRPVIDRLPRTVAYLIFELPSGVALTDTQEPLRQAYSRFTPSAEEMAGLLARWLPLMPLQQIDNRDAASALWDWTVASRSRAAPDLDAVEVCRYLALGEWAPGETLTREEIEKVRRLVTEADRLAEIAIHREVLWAAAGRLWQLHLALTFFPSDSLEPVARQLEVLRSDPDWLRRHLDGPDLHPGRRNALRPALLGFQEIRYPSSHGVEWRDDFAHTVLWAVFEGVPFDRQGALAPALQAFAVEPPERARLAGRYLDAYPEGRDEAARRVARSVAAPLLRETLTARRMREVIARLAEMRTRPRPRGWLGRLRHWVREARTWRRRIELIDAPAGARAASRAGERQIALAPWMRRLLERLLTELGEQRLAEEVSG